MNAIDGLFNSLSGFLEKWADQIPAIDIPFEKFTETWATVEGFITEVNSIFPLDTLLTIIGITLGFVAVMVVIWGIKFIKDMIPFI